MSMACHIEASHNSWGSLVIASANEASLIICAKDVKAGMCPPNPVPTITFRSTARCSHEMPAFYVVMGAHVLWKT